MAATTVNEQITDSVKQCNELLLGNSPNVALGFLLQATAQALANAGHNATVTQKNMNITKQTATSMGVALIHSLGTAVAKGG